MSDITLTATQRQTLLSLQDTTQLYNRTQTRLNTGKKVNTASDDAIAYYRSQQLYSRANNLGSLKTNIGQNIQALNTRQTTTAVETMLQQMNAVLESARSETPSQQAAATQQFIDLGNQLAQLVEDSTYQGLNLLTSSNASLVTQFSERTTSTFTVNGFNLIDSPGGSTSALFTQAAAVFNVQQQLVFSALVAAGATGPSPGLGVTSFT